MSGPRLSDAPPPERGGDEGSGGEAHPTSSEGADPSLSTTEGGVAPEAVEVSRSFVIANKKGLHARASARFVETVSRFESGVLVEKDDEEVSGDDLLGLLMLAGTMGSTILVTAAGPDANEAMDALEALVTNRFGEGE